MGAKHVFRSVEMKRLCRLTATWSKVTNTMDAMMIAQFSATSSAITIIQGVFVLSMEVLRSRHYSNKNNCS